MNYLEVKKLVSNYDHEHLLSFYGELSKDEKTMLIEQISKVDFSSINKLIENKYKPKLKDILPPKIIKLNDKEKRYSGFKIGQEALLSGKMGIVILAGGQGSRLGSPHAKGMYNVGLTKKISIFEIHIKKLLDFYNKTGTWLHCFIMTSTRNNSEIMQFFVENAFFGYNYNYIHFFKQSDIVTLDKDFKIMLSNKNTLCFSPNGNGLWYEDLLKNNYKDFLSTNGIEWLNVVAVDNVLQELVDPTFLGCVIQDSALCGSKVVEKIDKNEKIGTMCINGGQPDVLEYYEIPKELKEKRDKEGKLIYNYGVILNYIFNVKALDSIDYKKLPVHIVQKKVAYVDDNGNIITPNIENAWKLEYLLTDLIMHMRKCISFEVYRETSFAPIKNLTGVDSVVSAQKLLLKNGYEL